MIGTIYSLSATLRTVFELHTFTTLIIQRKSSFEERQGKSEPPDRSDLDAISF